jgi:HK97 family phage major capsid protein
VPVTELPAGGLGAAITPDQWANFVLQHLSAQSGVLASGASRIDTTLRVVHVPRVTSDGTAKWYGELEDIDDAGPSGDEVVLTPKKVAVLTKLSSEVIDDSSPSVLDTVGTAMTPCCRAHRRPCRPQWERSEGPCGCLRPSRSACGGRGDHD